MRINLLTSKTVIGAIIAGLGKLLEVPELAEYGDFIQALSVILQGVGLVIAAIGARTAIAKASQGVAQINPVAVLLAVLLAGPMVYTVNRTDWTITAPAGAWNFHGATAGVRGEDGKWYPDAEDSLTGDSLRVVIGWTHPTDGAGNEDSTVFRVTASKAVRWYSRDSVIVAASTIQRKRYLAGAITDSFKLAKPAAGDSATFKLTDFIQCRRGDCSIPGGTAGGYKTTWAPIPSAPSLRTSVF